MKQRKKAKQKALRPPAKGTARDAELLAEAAELDRQAAERQASLQDADGMAKLPDAREGAGHPRITLLEAVMQELPLSASRFSLVAVMTRRYKVSAGTVDRAIQKAKDAYAELADRKHEEILKDAQAFFREVQRVALSAKDARGAAEAKREELRLMGVNGPKGAEDAGTTDGRAEIAARLAAALVRGTEG